MNEGRTTLAALVLGWITLANLNLLLGTAAGLCGLIIAFPKAVQTVRDTDWKKLFCRK